jgi:hypothetical protein
MREEEARKMNKGRDWQAVTGLQQSSQHIQRRAR